MTIKHLYPDTRPTLDLKFAKDKKLDPRITFSRASSGTYVDANGVIQSAASGVARFDHNPLTRESLGLLVEEARTNIIKSSNNFIFNDWHFTQCKMTPNAVLAPDGTQTAALIQQTNGTSTRQFICTSYSVPLTGSPWTASVYVKKFNYDYVIFGAGDEDSGSRGTRFGYLQAQLLFQFSTKTLTVNPSTNWGGNVTGYGYEELPNGWFRLWVSKASFPRANYWGISVQQTLTGSSVISDDLNLVTGDNSSGVYLWGMQWESGSFKTSHIPTPATFTSRASTATYYDANGVIQTAASGVARSNAFFPDSSGVMRPAGLLLEAAGTNLVYPSIPYFTSTGGPDPGGWIAVNPFMLQNNAVAPDGNTTASRYSYGALDIYGGTVSTKTYSFFVKPTQSGSVFAFALTGDWSGGSDQKFLYNFDTKTFSRSSATGATLRQTLFPSGWVRISVTDTATASAHRFRIQTDPGAPWNAVNGPWHIWGFQHETGSYPTSYIPTAGSQVTRTADSSTSSQVQRTADVAQITGSNFSSWYNQSEGTVFSASTSSSSAAFTYTISDGSNFNRHGFNSGTSSGQPFVVISDISTIFGTAPTVVAGGGLVSYAYKANDYGVYGNGTSLNATSLATVPVGLTELAIGFRGTYLANTFINGTISRLTYYPTRLSNAILQTITS